MRALDRDYRAASRLDERRFYSIFYSKVQPSPVMVLGCNPGGDPDNWDESMLASRSFYEGSEHEYVDCNYRLAVVMRGFLSDALSLKSLEDLRSIPKTNLIFRRSRGQDTLAMHRSEALREASSFVERIIHRVQPKAIIFEGVTTLDKFEALYCSEVVRGVDGAAVKSPNGKSPASIFRFDRGLVRCLGRNVAFVGVGHPSKFAGRTEWPLVVSRARHALSAI